MTTRWQGFLALMATTLVVITTLAAVSEVTRERVAGNRARALWRQAEALTGTNDLHLRGMPPAAGSAMALSDGRRLLFGSVEGYGGPIDFLVLLSPGSTIAGLRITRHQETPGIGDFIDQPESAWMRQFIGFDVASLNSIDGKTGATITTNALRQGVQGLVNSAGDLP